MRSFRVVAGQNGYPSQFDNLRHDARGGAFLLAHQQLGALALPTTPTNGQTITFTVNGNAITLTAVTGTPTNPGDVKAPGTAAAFAANVLAILNQPQTTTANAIALSAANQQLLSYLSFSLVGTTITFSSANNSIFAPLSSFTASTTVTGASWTAQAMQLYVEPGVVYVSGTRVIFSGGSTPTVTAPSSNPRIDVLTIDNTGALAWTTGTEASSPSAPTYPANKVALCELYNVVGETALYDFENQTSGQGYVYNDVRPFLQPSMNWSAFSNDLIPDGDGTRNLGSPSFEWENIYAKSGIFLNGAPFGSQLTYAANALESISAGAPVAVGLSQATDIGYDTSGETNSSGSVTIGSNANRALLVIVIGTSGTPSGTFASQTLSFTTDSYTLGATTYQVATAILVAPPTGSGAFSIANASQVYYWSLYNCAQTTPQANRATNGAHNATSIAASMALGADGALAVGVIAASGLQTLGTIAGNVYNEHTFTNGSGPTYALGEAGVSIVYPSGQPVTISMSGASSADWLAAVLSVKPASVPSEGLFNASSASVAAGNTRCTGFVGFAVTSVTASQSLTVAINGVATGLSNLALGAEYYLNDTNGTIGTAPGSNTRKVGVAVSTTQLAITNGW